MQVSFYSVIFYKPINKNIAKEAVGIFPKSEVQFISRPQLWKKLELKYK